MERILVVGSNPEDREVRALTIEFRGYSCATAGSLDEAENLLQKGLFDLVVTDLKLRESSPEQVVKRLKGVCPDLAVLALTESGERPEAADEVLPIPFSPEGLFHGIDLALGKLAGLRARSRRERRRFTRYVVSLPCSIRATRSPKTEWLKTHTINMSSGGLHLVAMGEWKVGTRVECVVQLPGTSVGNGSSRIRSQGRIVRTVAQEQGGIGIGVTIESFEFIDFSEL